VKRRGERRTIPTTEEGRRARRKGDHTCHRGGKGEKEGKGPYLTQRREGEQGERRTIPAT
jgi:hypothetical protein